MCDMLSIVHHLRKC